MLMIHKWLVIVKRKIKNDCVLIDSYEEEIKDDPNIACDGVPHDQCENKLKK